MRVAIALAAMAAVAAGTVLCALGERRSQDRRFEVVVYGGTAGGVITAVAAAREGARVALLEPRDHLGGIGEASGDNALRPGGVPSPTTRARCVEVGLDRRPPADRNFSRRIDAWQTD